MRQRVLVVGAVIAFGLVFAAAPEALQRPSFSGRWVVSDSNGGYDLQLGREFGVTHTDNAILIDRNVSGAPSDPTRLRIYYLNGVETTLTVPPSPPRPAGTSKSLMTLGVEQLAWRAEWRGNQLMLVQKTTLTVTAPLREPQIERHLQTFTSSLSIDRDGQLVVERMTTVDLPANSAQGTMSRIVYKKG